MSSPLEELASTYFTLQEQINMLGVACETQDQRDALSKQYVQARQNYLACQNQAFHEDDAQVVTLTSEIAAANQQLKSAVEQMGDIAKTITDITNAVTLGAQLATKVITL